MPPSPNPLPPPSLPLSLPPPPPPLARGRQPSRALAQADHGGGSSGPSGAAATLGREATHSLHQAPPQLVPVVYTPEQLQKLMDELSAQMAVVFTKVGDTKLAYEMCSEALGLAPLD